MRVIANSKRLCSLELETICPLRKIKMFDVPDLLWMRTEGSCKGMNKFNIRNVRNVENINNLWL